MGECITIHVGQAGIQMGNSAWELLCLEHGVKQDGSLIARDGESHSQCSILRKTQSVAPRTMGSRIRVEDRQDPNTRGVKTANTLKDNKGSSFSMKPSITSMTSRDRVADSRHCMGMNTSSHLMETKTSAFFEELRKGKVTPRQLMIDTDCTAISELLNGQSHELHQRERMISAREGTGGIFSSGYFTKEGLLNDACDQISKMSAKCDNLHSFIMFRSCGGGTGSGLASALMLRLVDEYGGKKSILEINTGPTRKANEMMSPLVTEPYNAILSTHKSMCSSECVFLMDNNTMYDICEDKLSIEQPQYTNLNRLIGQLMSSLTSSLRYNDEHNVYPNDLQKHMMPFPRMKFPLASFAPLTKKCFTENNWAPDATEITKECFDPKNHLMVFNPRVGNYLGCTLLYRGNIGLQDVTDAIGKVKRLGRFTNHCEPDFVIGITAHTAPLVPFGDIGFCPRSAVLVSNTTAVKESWTTVVNNFDMMFKRRAFVHWFLSDGMEFDEFLEAREQLASLVKEYDDVDYTVSRKFGSPEQNGDETNDEE